MLLYTTDLDQTFTENLFVFAPTLTTFKSRLESFMFDWNSSTHKSTASVYIWLWSYVKYVFRFWKHYALTLFLNCHLGFLDTFHPDYTVVHSLILFIHFHYSQMNTCQQLLISQSFGTMTHPICVDVKERERGGCSLFTTCRFFSLSTVAVTSLFPHISCYHVSQSNLKVNIIPVTHDPCYTKLCHRVAVQRKVT